MLPTKNRNTKGNKGSCSKGLGRNVSQLMLCIYPADKKISIHNIGSKMMVLQSNMMSPGCMLGALASLTQPLLSSKTLE
jgi:hypothetical protein